MLTSLIEILELPHLQCNLNHVKIQNTSILRRPRVVNFAEIIKIGTCLLKQSLKTQKD